MKRQFTHICLTVAIGLFAQNAFCNSANIHLVTNVENHTDQQVAFFVNADHSVFPDTNDNGKTGETVVLGKQSFVSNVVIWGHGNYASSSDTIENSCVMTNIGNHWAVFDAQPNFDYDTNLGSTSHVRIKNEYLWFADGPSGGGAGYTYQRCFNPPVVAKKGILAPNSGALPTYGQPFTTGPNSSTGTQTTEPAISNSSSSAYTEIAEPFYLSQDGTGNVGKSGYVQIISTYPVQPEATGKSSNLNNNTASIEYIEAVDIYCLDPQGTNACPDAAK